MIYAILLAGGNSQRFGDDKLAQKINDVSIWMHSLQLLAGHKSIDGIVVVGRSDDTLPRQLKSKVITAKAGNTRFGSLQNGLDAIAHIKPDDIVVVHNAANPLATKKEISKAIRFATKYGAAGVARRLTGTIRKVGRDFFGLEVLDRSRLVSMETPQALRGDVLTDGLKNITNPQTITDDLMIAEAIGCKPHIFLASPYNKKITTQADFEIARFIKRDVPMSFLCGVGEDSHRFDNGKDGVLRLGGIDVPSMPAMEANSDGDVILHALCNAICSSLGEGSFSEFADDMCAQGITDSTEYFKHVMEVMESRGYRLNNLSISLEAAQPKIDPLVPDIKKSLSELGSIAIDRIGITATTGEQGTDWGKGKGIKATTMVSLVQ